MCSDINMQADYLRYVVALITVSLCCLCFFCSGHRSSGPWSRYEHEYGHGYEYEHAHERRLPAQQAPRRPTLQPPPSPTWPRATLQLRRPRSRPRPPHDGPSSRTRRSRRRQRQLLGRRLHEGRPTPRRPLPPGARAGRRPGLQRARPRRTPRRTQQHGRWVGHPSTSVAKTDEFWIQ